MHWIRGAVALLLTTFAWQEMAVSQEKPTGAEERDRAAIGQMLRQFVDAWNTHDAHAFALTFTEDADFTNVAGMSAHGRDKVKALHAPVFATIFKDSHQTAQIRSIRFLTPNLAQVDVDWQMTGATLRDGSPRPDRKGLLDWLVRRQAGGSWLIEVMHNTDLTNVPNVPPATAK